LTGCRVPAKAEGVSESLDKITGDYLRLQLFPGMPTKNQKITPSRKPRTGAQRNRERILEVAKEAFTRCGANASLHDIAKEAGVGAVVGSLISMFSPYSIVDAQYMQNAMQSGQLGQETKFQLHFQIQTALRQHPA
jgi:hypothetical protein